MLQRIVAIAFMILASAASLKVKQLGFNKMLKFRSCLRNSLELINAQKISAVLLSAAVAFSLPSMPVTAAVGEGDLPVGAMAFSKVLKYQVFHSLIVPASEQIL